MHYRTAHLNCIKAYAGQTLASSAETAFNNEDFNEAEFLAHMRARSGNIELVMNWYVESMHFVGPS